MLQQCVDLLQQYRADELADTLKQEALGPILEAPADFSGPSESALVRLRLNLEQRNAILDYVKKAVVERRSTVATRKRGLGGFAQAWQEYCDYEDTYR